MTRISDEELELMLIVTGAFFDCQTEDDRQKVRDSYRSVEEVNPELFKELLNIEEGDYMNVLKDIRNVQIEIEDTVSIAYTNYDTGGSSQEIAVVKGVNSLTNEIILEDGEPIPIDKFDVLVLPEYYSGSL
jgi:hypothetical protein